MDLQTLKAAMVLVSEDVKWVRGTVDFDGKKYVVCQCMPDKAELVMKFLFGYGLTVTEITGNTQSSVLFPIEVTQLSNVYDALPPLTLKDDEGNVVKVKDGDVDNYDELSTKNKTLFDLHAAGMQRLEVQYSGSGDNSNDDEFEFNNCALPFYPDYSNEGNKLLTLAWHQALHAKPLGAEFQQRISDWIWNDLTSNYDCHNNDGGGGTLTFDLSDPSAPTVHFTLYTNEMVTNDHEDTDL